MTNELNLYEHLLHIAQMHLEANRLPFEQRAKLLKEAAAYYEKYLSNEEAESVEEVLEAKQHLYQELSEAIHFESSYNLLYAAFAKARDQLRHDPEQFEGFHDLLEQIPCKSPEKTIIELLRNDEVSLEILVRLYLAEHHAILHPDTAPTRFQEMLDTLDF